MLGVNSLLTKILYGVVASYTIAWSMVYLLTQLLSWNNASEWYFIMQIMPIVFVIVGVWVFVESNKYRFWSLPIGMTGIFFLLGWGVSL